MIRTATNGSYNGSRDDRLLWPARAISIGITSRQSVDLISRNSLGQSRLILLFTSNQTAGQALRIGNAQISSRFGAEREASKAHGFDKVWT
jgi:hypothetical protein